MNRSANINVRTNPVVKKTAEAIFADFGLSLSDAVNIFLHKVIQVQGLPFSVRHENFNQTTIEAMKEAQDIASGAKQAKSYKNAQELFDELDSEC